MAKNSVSEWSIVSSENGDIAGLTLGLDMPPSYVNNSIQEMMAQIKQWKDGYTDPVTGLPVYQSLTVENIDIEGIANFKGGMALDGSYGDAGQVIVSQGESEAPVWGSGFPTGGIIMWSGSVETIPTGWALCNGENSTPDLRDKFVVGAGNTYAVDETGGNADATLPAHTHTGSTNTTGNHSHTLPHYLVQAVSGSGDIDRDNEYQQWKALSGQSTNTTGNHAHTFTTDSSGESETNANLPPYYALCYIMKV
jgi:microcystin-dependent protein